MKDATAQQSYQNDTDEKRASWRRRNHADIEAMQNLIVSAVAAETGRELPPKCRLLLSAIQGAHGGGKVVNEEFERGYLSLAAQLQFTGTEDAQRSRVRDWVDAFDEWQAQTYLLVLIKKGGEIIGYDGDEPIRKATTFIDLVKPIADAAVVRARASARWREHPGKALAAQVESAVEQLPRHPEYKAPGAPPEPPAPHPSGFTLSEYVKSREDRQLAEDRRIHDKLKEGEPVSVEEIDARLAALEVHYAHIKAEAERNYESTRAALLSLRDSRCSRMMDFTDPEQVAREVDERINAPKGDAPPASWLDEALGDTQARHGDTRAHSGNYRMRNFPAPREGEVEEVIVEGGGVGKNIPPNAESPAKTIGNEPDMCAAALEWARSGLPVHPLYEVTAEGVCVCHRAAGCLTPGKHPRLPRWEQRATTDEKTIREWWRKFPRANIGGAMGGASRLHAVDVDPKNGGNASLCDLSETHGDEWLDTFTVETGSGGLHFLFILPEGVELKNTAGKLAPGIDSRGSNGQIVLAPSLHASGNRYRVKERKPLRVADEWLVAELSRAEGVKPAKPIDFQERRAVAPGARYFGVGERNDGLTSVMCGRWRHGWAQDVRDLYEQMREVRDTRCTHDANDPPPSDEWLWDLAQRTAAKFTRGDLAQREGSA
jgi:putative DNA primase/helicase